MKTTNYLLIGFVFTSLMISCTSEPSSTEEKTNDATITDGTYHFLEVKEKDDELFLAELILTVKGNEITGTSNRWFEEGDHEFISLATLTMSEAELKGTIDGTNLVLQEKETEYGADHPDDYVLKFGEPETWSWEGNQLMHSGKDMIMKKVAKEELPSSTYRKFDNAKITH